MEERQKSEEVDHLSLLKKGTEGLEELFWRQEKEKEGMGLFNQKVIGQLNYIQDKVANYPHQ